MLSKGFDHSLRGRDTLFHLEFYHSPAASETGLAPWEKIPAAPAGPKESSLPNHLTVKKVGGGEGKGSFLVSTGTNYASGTFMEFFSIIKIVRLGFLFLNKQRL